MPSETVSLVWVYVLFVVYSLTARCPGSFVGRTLSRCKSWISPVNRHPRIHLDWNSMAAA
jgi:hypothetical protein